MLKIESLIHSVLKLYWFVYNSYIFETSEKNHFFLFVI